MKKINSLILTLIMTLSLCSPALATERTADYSPAEIAKMNVSQLSAVSTRDKNIVSQLDNALEDATFLADNITDAAVIENLSVDDLDTLASIIEANSLTRSQADNLVNTWQTCKRVSSDTPVDLEYAQILNARQRIEDTSVSPFAYSGNITTHVNSKDYTGVHYMVKSTAGYNKVSGTFTLPSLNIKSSTSDPDVPYGIFGIYVGSDIGFDLGTCYKQSTNDWRFIISGYVTNASGGSTRYWRELTGQSFSPGSISKVNFVAKIIKGSTYDTLSLTVVDASSWTSLGIITLNTNEKGYDGGAGASKSYVSSNYSNVYINREVTLAHKSQSYRPMTGTSIKNAKWSDVYIYNPSTYSKWGTAQAQYARKIGQSSTYADTVNVTITTKWSEDTTNIYYG